MICHRENIKRKLETFREQKQGSVAPLFAFLALTLLVSAGFAIDLTRAVNAREKLSYAMDAAALSLATDLSTTVMSEDEIAEAASDYLIANLGGVAFADEALTNLNHNVDSANGMLTLETRASVKNQFIHLANGDADTTSFSVALEVAYSSLNLELALVVDVTGSMGSSIEALKDASTSLLDVLRPAEIPVEDSRVKISFVPYSTGVYAPDYAQTLMGGDFHDIDSSSNCLTERDDYDSHSVKYTDAPYDYFGENPPVETFFGGGLSSCNHSAELVPLTADRNELISNIDDMTASGGTAGQTGIAWGWYSLSPNFSNVWPEDSTPSDYDAEKTQKIAVVMTDGSNNVFYERVSCGWNQIYGQWVWGGSCWISPDDRWYALGEYEYYNNVSSTRSRALCDAMKDEGIAIYTVFFGSNTGSAGAQTMQYCASDGNYYPADSTSELVSAFGKIARKVQNVYLSH